MHLFPNLFGVSSVCLSADCQHIPACLIRGVPVFVSVRPVAQYLFVSALLTSTISSSPLPRSALRHCSACYCCEVGSVCLSYLGEIWVRPSYKHFE